MKKTLTMLFAAAGCVSASELNELFTLTDSTQTVTLSDKGLQNDNSLTFVLTLDPEKLASLGEDPYRHDFFTIDVYDTSFGVLYYSDMPQFGVFQGKDTVKSCSDLLPGFSWNDVESVALAFTTAETASREGDIVDLHVYIMGKDGNEILSTSYTKGKKLSKVNGPTGFNEVSMTDIVKSATGYKGTATPEQALAMAKEAALGLSVPEPTTATLSLLALAGLAARRRR